eukprot:gnl/MRDRNA2_/MRDRNA2_95863_c0_seq1.p3 gnl/MRDRNA2_/MRDRNA2_95863_c0~~gnl/MRDRNA2_/MRDRNA2_95863_c0_seq1.p3  ORF type:complete len:139 (+),score=32.54 gnl/MRDRNA2_/MRDRNA2_95863_c0_seq1:83-499(+)
MVCTSLCVFVAVLSGSAAYQFEPNPKTNPSLVAMSAGAPAGAPGAAPGPAASPAAPKDNWGADTHAEEFGNEYVHHVREGLKEPHVGEKGWMSETHANVANFDPHGRDFLTDSRSPVVFSGAAAPTVAVLAVLVCLLH